MDIQSLAHAFQRTAKLAPNDIALRSSGEHLEITWAEYAQRVEKIAAGLARLGIRSGDAVGLMMVNRPEFHLCDTAALHLGATPFSVYNTSSDEQLEYLFQNAGNKVLITEMQFLSKLRRAAESTEVVHIICVDDVAPDTLSLAELEQQPAERFDFKAAWQAVAAENIATLIYTSGTTGPPKGVELTHANILAQVELAAKVLPVKYGDRFTSYLPSAHIADRVAAHYNQLVFGLQVTSVADPTKIAEVLPKFRPTVWGGVPRVWEKIKGALESAGITEPAQMPEDARKALLAKIGLDRVRWTCSGGAPIPPEVLNYFLDLGVPICEVWGMSELACYTTINPIDDIRCGTVGKAIPGIELKTGTDGELFVRGPTVMRGYRNMPDKTAETIDTAGWLATGDIGTIDDDGYVTIIDRKKDIFINSAGKNMSPANIERILRVSNHLIAQAVVIGDARPYNVALLTLDPDAARLFADQAGLADTSAQALSQNHELQQAIKASVAAANERLSRVEQIKNFCVIGEYWEPGSDVLTPTSKPRRQVIANKYAEDIDLLYSQSSSGMAG